MKLILFDVDGILIKLFELKGDYWKIAAKKHFNLEVSKHNVYGLGKTERQIFFEHLKLKGIKDPEKDERFDTALKDTAEILSEIIKDTKLEQVENVEKLIKALIKENHTIGVLTGNGPKKTRIKLENAGLWKYFKIGAYGHETKVRSELVPIAIKDAKEKTGISFKKKDVYLVGDTIRDIQCAKEGGVKIIAVATGTETIETLAKEKPDYLFKDFSDTKKILEAINE
ncbi:MAG: HAD hydrolase-like protein [archaeon]|jgi:phosphoglycolate phosphatase-like HAD superfamily hydrolase